MKFCQSAVQEEMWRAYMSCYQPSAHLSPTALPRPAFFSAPPLTQWLACDASPAPSDCSDQIQAQPDVTPTPACSCVITEDGAKEASPTRLEKRGPHLILSVAFTFQLLYLFFSSVYETPNGIYSVFMCRCILSTDKIS